MSKISVIIPVYNINENYLRECIESVINQTMREIEIFLVDDGSTNDSKQICKEYAQKDSRIIFYSQKNKGVSVARNYGIENSTGEFLCFVDADDWLSNDALEKMYEVAKNQNIDILLSGHLIEIDGKTIDTTFKDNRKIIFNKEELNQLQLNILDASSFYKNVSIKSPWIKLFKNSFIKKNNLLFNPKLRRMQDSLFCIEAIELANIVGYFDYAAYHYRIQSESSGNKYNPQIVVILEEVLKAILDFNKKYEKDDEFSDAFNVKVIVVLMEYIRLKYLHEECELDLTEAIREYKDICSKEQYKIAIENVKLEKIQSLKRKVFVILIRNKMQFILFIVSYLNYFIKRRIRG